MIIGGVSCLFAYVPLHVLSKSACVSQGSFRSLKPNCKKGSRILPTPSRTPPFVVLSSKNKEEREIHYTDFSYVHFLDLDVGLRAPYVDLVMRFRFCAVPNPIQKL